MSIWTTVSSQFGRPTGPLGSIAGAIMATRGSNRERMLWAISRLNLRETDQVLEVGFGPGVAIEKISTIVTKGTIWGIDHSEVMVRQASRRNNAAISEGRVKLLHGSVSTLPALDIRPTKVLDINAFQFWQSPAEVLPGLRAVMEPGGTIAIVHQPRKPGSTGDDADAAGERIAEYLSNAGFRNIRAEKRDMKPVPAVCVTGKA